MKKISSYKNAVYEKKEKKLPKLMEIF